MYASTTPVDISHLYPLFQYLRRSGHNTHTILHAMGLHKYGIRLEQLPKTLPLEHFLQAIAKAKVFSKDPILCLRAGQQQTSVDFSLLAQLGYHSRNIEQALRLYCRYLTAFNPGFPTRLVIGDNEVDTPINNNGWPQELAAPLMELRLSNCIRFLRIISGDQQPDLIKRVQFEHPCPDKTFNFDELLKTEVKFSQAHASMVVHRDALHRPIQTYQADMLEKVIAIAEDKRLQAGIESTHIVVKVRAAIRFGLAKQKSTLADIAAQLNLSTSSLKRHLSAENRGFQELLDLEKKQEMEYWILHTPITLEAISRKLGYASQASFNQACHRLLKVSPSGLRKQQDI